MAARPNRRWRTEKIRSPAPALRVNGDCVWRSLARSKWRGQTARPVAACSAFAAGATIAATPTMPMSAMAFAKNGATMPNAEIDALPAQTRGKCLHRRCWRRRGLDVQRRLGLADDQSQSRSLDRSASAGAHQYSFPPAKRCLVLSPCEFLIPFRRLLQHRVPQH